MLKDGLSLRVRARSRCYVWWHRACNRWWDARAVFAGYCNHSPWHPDPGQGGGYLTWRCGLKRRHDGMHRSRNYVWGDDGRTDYVPIPVVRHPGRGQEMPDQPWNDKRSMTPTRRQERARRRWDERQRAEILARREVTHDAR